MPRLCLKQTAAERFGQSHLFGAGDRMSQDGTKKNSQNFKNPLVRIGEKKVRLGAKTSEL